MFVCLLSDEIETKEEAVEDDSYFDNDNELMDTEFFEEEGNISGDVKTPEYAIANVSCQYDGSSSTYMKFNHLFA